MGQQEQVEVDFEAVVEAFSNQIMTLSRENAVKDGVISALKKQVQELQHPADVPVER